MPICIFFKVCVCFRIRVFVMLVLPDEQAHFFSRHVVLRAVLWVQLLSNRISNNAGPLHQRAEQTDRQTDSSTNSHRHNYQLDWVPLSDINTSIKWLTFLSISVSYTGLLETVAKYIHQSWFSISYVYSKQSCWGGGIKANKNNPGSRGVIREQTFHAQNQISGCKCIVWAQM